MIEALRRAFSGVADAEAQRLTRLVLQRAARESSQLLELPVEQLARSRLGHDACDACPAELGAAIARAVGARLGARPDRRRAAHVLGEVLDEVLALRMRIEGAAAGQASTRRSSGSFFTPRELSLSVVRQALLPLLPQRAESLRICDPAVGGGSFLIECCVVLSERYQEAGRAPTAARRLACAALYGVDRSELALAVTEVALWLYVGEPGLAPGELGLHLGAGDALCGEVWQRPRQGAEVPIPASAGTFDWHRAFPEAAAEGFDLVVGNPPWVAYAGRSAQPLAPDWRSYFKRSFAAFSGFPTLQGLFVERAAALAPRGRVALLLPSAVADLDGYKATRRALTRSHVPLEPLRELGQDAFEGVVQPSFVLLADPRASGEGSEAPWRLEERGRSGAVIVYAPAPPVLDRLGALPCLPPTCFRELGFQSNRQVSERLLYRGDASLAPTDVPLLEGRNVQEFREGAPRLYLRASEQELRSARSRLRSLAEFGQVQFVVRQTAAITIAARHGLHAFRNSLLAGYGAGDLDADLLVGLLNSSLFRALHLGRRRDARQLTFPQVKIAHLRALPAPPSHEAGRERVRQLSRQATELGACSSALRAALDSAVACLFGLTEAEHQAVERFLMERLGNGGQGRRSKGEDAPRACAEEELP